MAVIGSSVSMDDLRTVIEREMRLAMQQHVSSGMERAAIARIRANGILNALERGVLKDFSHTTTIAEENIRQVVDELGPDGHVTAHVAEKVQYVGLFEGTLSNVVWRGGEDPQLAMTITYKSGKEVEFKTEIRPTTWDNLVSNLTEENADKIIRGSDITERAYTMVLWTFLETQEENVLDSWGVAYEFVYRHHSPRPLNSIFSTLVKKAKDVSQTV